MAGLIARYGDFQLAEDVLMDTLAVALDRWARDGMPLEPVAWIRRTARNRAIDRLRRRRTRHDKGPTLAALHALEQEAAEPDAPEVVTDERLRLVFTCCHPALAMEARVALTLRTLGGLTTPEIARAFLVQDATMAQRLVRAKKKIQAAGIPFRVPDPAELPERVAGVRTTLYLVFNEGYAASSGQLLVRADLCREAIRLTRLVDALLPDDPETVGLLALMLLQDARRPARLDADGCPVVLEDQDRSLWRHAEIDEGRALVARALRMGSLGPFQLQAAISALHGEAPSFAETDWTQIAGLYSLLERLTPSPVVRLNRAVAISYASGPADALPIVDALAADGSLQGYGLLAAARGDLLARLGRRAEAAAAFHEALAVSRNEGDRVVWRRRLAALG